MGVIPEEWELKTLGDAADFLDGQRRPVRGSERAKMRGDIPYYGASGIVDYVNGFLFNEDLILLGEDGENILSRNCRLAFKISGETWVNNHAHVLRPKTGIVLDYLVESVVMTTNLPFKQWSTVFPGAACVGALIDRFAQHCHTIDIEADSWRQKESLALTKPQPADAEPAASTPSKKR